MNILGIGVGINTIAGYWRPPEGKPGPAGGAPAYDERARQAGLYFIPPFDARFMDEMTALEASRNVLSWIHEDEPDMPETRCDAKIEVVDEDRRITAEDGKFSDRFEPPAVHIYRVHSD
jgi:hypothetical protein